MVYNLAHVKAGNEQGGTTLHASNSNLSKEANESKHISQVKFDIFSHSTSKQLYSSPNPNVTSSNNENLECRQNKDTHQTESQSINYNENVIIKENGSQALEESSKGKKILHEDLTSAAKPSTRKSKRKVQKRGGKQVLSKEPIQRTVVLGLPAQPKFKGNLFP
ncbi:hypothetical protein ACET3Z_022846 [Daucus carota]